MFKLFTPLAIFLILPVFVFPQGNSISLSTYYPAPEGVFKELEVKKALSVGEIKNSGITGLDDVSQLKEGQVFMEHSLRLAPLFSEPLDPVPGQVIFLDNGTKKTLRLYDGEKWNDI